MSHKLDKAEFLSITASMRWAKIDEIVDACDQADYWTEEFLDGAVLEAKKSATRRLIKQLKDNEGMPLFHSVEATSPESGEPIKVYMQEELFVVDDYRAVVTYHDGKASYHKSMAKKLNRRCYDRYRVSVLPGLAA
jgi:hypothetical protein